MVRMLPFCSALSYQRRMIRHIVRPAGLTAALLLSGNLSPQAQRAAPPPARADSTIFSRTRALGRLGFPDGLSLDGPYGDRTIAFRLPGSAPVDSARLDLKL